MKIGFNKRPSGIALIIVMVTIFVLAVLAGAFAFSMKIETKLARNASYETELEWLGRSGVEVAKYVLALQMNSPNEPYDSLNQVWAGGPGSALSSNTPLSSITLKDHKFKLGNGTFQVTITDLERKLNINAAANSPDILNQAFITMGVDAGEYPQIVASIQDWIDTDDNPHIGGAESDYYGGLKPPYLAKNGPIDDLSELLLIKGITPEMYWGSGSTNVPQPVVAARQNAFSSTLVMSNTVGLVDLLTPISSGKLNLNTVSAQTLQMFPGLDQNMASTIILLRVGPDGVDGTEDDTPFGGAGGSVSSALRQATGSGGGQLANLFTDRSSTFEVQVDVEISGYRKRYVAIVGRTSAQDIQTLVFREQ
jgi:general secretion pathway protein K